tara:strand:+ start:184 stop:636 length:453 start_codon:yes stop_codon:yes gene_type:complete
MTGKVVKIGISKLSGGQIISLGQAEVIKGRGIINDRFFTENNEKKNQITLIEIENIDNYNKSSKTDIPPLNFRRNIVTEGIRLNSLIGKELLIGSVKVIGHDLCRPCKHLQENLNQTDIIKKFLHTGGLRCEILSSGKIFVGDIIKQKND